MNNTVDIDFIRDEKYNDPKVTVRAKERTQLVDNIIQAVENVSENHFPRITAYDGEDAVLLSQRDIISAVSHEHKVMILTETGSYIVKTSLIALEKVLDPERFLRISQSEIINLYKVKLFDLSISGSIGILFENGTKTRASRRYLKAIKDILSQ